jgi:hypothetical protein
VQHRHDAQDGLIGLERPIEMRVDLGDELSRCVSFFEE